MTLILKRPAGAGLILKRPVGARLELTPTNLLPDDPDAIAYIAAVEAADGQALEPATRLAINSFVKGCKVDGTWPALRACCLMVGARTLAGALVPLVGPAPTNFNFVAGDYDRKTGLKGNGTSKYLNSNRADNADPQNSFSMSIYLVQAGANSVAMIGSGGPTYSQISTTSFGKLGFYNRSSLDDFVGSNSGNQFLGSSRSNATIFTRRYGGATTTLTASSATANGGNIFVYADNNAGTAMFFSSARLAFYHIGESLNLPLLDARVSALMAALAAAIP